MTVAITRLDISASELREAAAGTQDAKAVRRMLAIALVLDGWSRDAAAEACAMDRQTLRDWVHRYKTDRGWTGWLTGHAATARRPASRTNCRRKWRNGLSKARSSSGTAWSVGAAVSICSRGSRRNFLCTCTSARWASCCASFRSGGFRCGRSIRKASPRSRRFSARVCCPCNRSSAARSDRQAGGGLVHRRGAGTARHG